MYRIIDIEILEPFKIACHFKNGEKRLFDLEKSLNKSQKYTQKLLEGDVFSTAKVDSLGGIYWEGMAEMTDLEGNTIPCDYDISPEFVYMNSRPTTERALPNS